MVGWGSPPGTTFTADPNDSLPVGQCARELPLRTDLFRERSIDPSARSTTRPSTHHLPLARVTSDSVDRHQTPDCKTLSSTSSRNEKRGLLPCHSILDAEFATIDLFMFFSSSQSLPLDHGMIYGPMRGIEDPAAMVRNVIAGAWMVSYIHCQEYWCRAGRCGTVHKLTNSASNDDCQILLGGVYKTGWGKMMVLWKCTSAPRSRKRKSRTRGLSPKQ